MIFFLRIHLDSVFFKFSRSSRFCFKNRTVDFAGLMATRGIVKKTIQGFGGRIAAKQVTKFIPLGGQLVAATMGYTIFKKIANDHVEECYKLAKDIQKKQHSKNV